MKAILGGSLEGEGVVAAIYNLRPKNLSGLSRMEGIETLNSPEAAWGMLVGQLPPYIFNLSPVRRPVLAG